MIAHFAYATKNLLLEVVFNTNGTFYKYAEHFLSCYYLCMNIHTTMNAYRNI